MSLETEPHSWQLYSAKYKLGHNPFRSVAAVWKDLTGSSWQTWMIFKSEFAATFRKTLIGMFWGFILPLVPLLAFFFLTTMRVFPTNGAIHPLSYMAVGVTLWLYLQGLIMAPTIAIEKHVPVLKSSGFPIICLFAASYGQLAFDMLIRIIVVTPILFWFYHISMAGLGLILFLLFPATAFGIAIGILLGLAGIVLHDLRNVATIIFRYLIFISFAIFPLSNNDIGQWLYALNPFAIFIDNIRCVLILDHLATPIHFVVASAISFLLLLISLHIYNILERRIVGAL